MNKKTLNILVLLAAATLTAGVVLTPYKELRAVLAILLSFDAILAWFSLMETREKLKDSKFGKSAPEMYYGKPPREFDCGYLKATCELLTEGFHFKLKITFDRQVNGLVQITGLESCNFNQISIKPSDFDYAKRFANREVIVEIPGFAGDIDQYLVSVRNYNSAMNELFAVLVPDQKAGVPRDELWHKMAELMGCK